jgi:hypothetical protein
MTVEIDPGLRQQFEQNLADHQSSVARVDATLAARQREITEQAAKADAKFSAERGELLAKMQEQYKQPVSESDKPRRAGWVSTASTRQDDGLMSFGTEEDAVEESPVQAPPPAAPSPPPAPSALARSARHRRAREHDEDDYSEQTWLRE